MNNLVKTTLTGCAGVAEETIDFNQPRCSYGRQGDQFPSPHRQF